MLDYREFCNYVIELAHEEKENVQVKDIMPLLYLSSLLYKSRYKENAYQEQETFLWHKNQNSVYNKLFLDFMTIDKRTGNITTQSKIKFEKDNPFNIEAIIPFNINDIPESFRIKAGAIIKQLLQHSTMELDNSLKRDKQFLNNEPLVNNKVALQQIKYFKF